MYPGQLFNHFKEAIDHPYILPKMSLSYEIIYPCTVAGLSLIESTLNNVHYTVEMFFIDLLVLRFDGPKID